MQYVGNIRINIKIGANFEIFGNSLTQYNYDGIYCKIPVQVMLQCQLNRQKIFGSLNLSKFLSYAICSSRVLCTENVIIEWFWLDRSFESERTLLFCNNQFTFQSPIEAPGNVTDLTNSTDMTKYGNRAVNQIIWYVIKYRKFVDIRKIYGNI